VIDLAALPRRCAEGALPLCLRGRFVPLTADEELSAWLRMEAAAPHGALPVIAHRFLRGFLSDYDVNGLLGTYPLYLLGSAQWEALIGGGGGRLLDVGAGSGAVTARAEPLFEEIVATETSWAMARRLRARGYTVHELDLAETIPPGIGTFRVVSLLNVLDRSHRPRTLLACASALLGQGGKLLISIPLPARPHVDVGATTVDPDEPIGADGETFEEALGHLVRDTLRPQGIEVEAFSRVPYLSRSDGEISVIALDAAVLVCRPAIS
jgi:SAM-dependent methyltransferase